MRLHGLRPALTSFVGRAGAVDTVAALLGKHRLVTVTGPGGMGKTRLADVARQVAERLPPASRPPGRRSGIPAGPAGIPRVPVSACRTTRSPTARRGRRPRW